MSSFLLSTSSSGRTKRIRPPEGLEIVGLAKEPWLLGARFARPLSLLLSLKLLANENEERVLPMPIAVVQFMSNIANI